MGQTVVDMSTAPPRLMRHRRFRPGASTSEMSCPFIKSGAIQREIILL
jgi:hypothetical protein